MARRNRFLGRWLAHGERLSGLERAPVRSAACALERATQCTSTCSTDGPYRQARRRSAARVGANRSRRISAKQNRYTHAAGRGDARAWRALSSSACCCRRRSRFLRFYVLRGGFLDGTAGLAHIAIGCFNSFCKYAKLRALEQAERGDESAGDRRGGVYRHASGRAPPARRRRRDGVDNFDPYYDVGLKRRARRSGSASAGVTL